MLKECCVLYVVYGRWVCVYATVCVVTFAIGRTQPLVPKIPMQWELTLLWYMLMGFFAPASLVACVHSCYLSEVHNIHPAAIVDSVIV